MKTTIDNQAIIARGYTLDEEYDAILKTNRLEKLNLGDGSHDRLSDSEGIWIYSLEPDKSNRSGENFHFVFFNDPIHFWGGPRCTSGLVAAARSHGPNMRATALLDECIAAFKKTGKPAIDYAYSVVEKKPKAKKK